jgi:hypothetical protein
VYMTRFMLGKDLTLSIGMSSVALY